MNEETIHIEQLDIFARVGVTEQERANLQRLTLTITVWPKEKFENLQDDIGRTVDYSAICVAAREFAHPRSNRLIETLADQLAQHLLQNFPLRQIKLELRKFVLPDAAYVAACVTRTAPAD
ncbi:MAG: dihydroneopterin aldolase [Verrucomicrobiota bacterium]